TQDALDEVTEERLIRRFVVTGGHASLSFRSGYSDCLNRRPILSVLYHPGTKESTTAVDFFNVDRKCHVFIRLFSPEYYSSIVPETIESDNPLLTDSTNITH